MKRSHWIHVLRTVLATMLIAFIGVFAAACFNNEEEQPKVYPETGVYRCYDVGNDQTALTLSEGTNFVLAVNGGTKSGTYKLTD